jgi:hypothetical protein
MTRTTCARLAGFTWTLDSRTRMARNENELSQHAVDIWFCAKIELKCEIPD